MIALSVRFDLREEVPAKRSDGLTAEAAPEIPANERGTLVYATHVIDYRADRNPLLAGAPRVEFVAPGPTTGLPSA
jgi:hypothetical protein